MEVGALRSGDPDRLGPYALIGRVGEGGQGDRVPGRGRGRPAGRDQAAARGADVRRQGPRAVHAGAGGRQAGRAVLHRAGHRRRRRPATGPTSSASTSRAVAEPARRWPRARYAAPRWTGSRSAPSTALVGDPPGGDRPPRLQAAQRADGPGRPPRHRLRRGAGDRRRPRRTPAGSSAPRPTWRPSTSRAASRHRLGRVLLGGDHGVRRDGRAAVRPGHHPRRDQPDPAPSEPDLGGLRAPLRELVLDCLEKDPAPRPTASQVLMRLLGRDEVPGGRRTARRARVRRRRRDRDARRRLRPRRRVRRPAGRTRRARPRRRGHRRPGSPRLRRRGQRGVRARPGVRRRPRLRRDRPATTTAPFHDPEAPAGRPPSTGWRREHPRGLDDAHDRPLWTGTAQTRDRARSGLGTPPAVAVRASRCGRPAPGAEAGCGERSPVRAAPPCWPGRPRCSSRSW